MSERERIPHAAQIQQCDAVVDVFAHVAFAGTNRSVTAIQAKRTFDRVIVGFVGIAASKGIKASPVAGGRTEGFAPVAREFSDEVARIRAHGVSPYFVPGTFQRTVVRIRALQPPYDGL